MTNDELIALAKEVATPSGIVSWPVDMVALARAFLEAHAERDSLTFVLKETQAEAARLQRIEVERDAARAEVERLREFETRYVRLTSVRTSHGPPCVCDRCLSVMFAERTAKAEAELSALRAEIEAGSVVYLDPMVKAWSEDESEQDTHRARLVRIEKL